MFFGRRCNPHPEESVRQHRSHYREQAPLTGNPEQLVPRLRRAKNPLFPNRSKLSNLC